MIDKDKLKQSLTLEQVWDLVNDLGGNPHDIQDGYFVSQTICHNAVGQGSYKLYYYANSQLFRCYTACSETFDIYDLVRKQKTIAEECEWTLPQAIAYVAFYFGYDFTSFDFGKDKQALKDWNILDNYEKNNNYQQQKQIVELKYYDDKILKNLPQPRIPAWEQEGISKDIIKRYKIAYDPVNEGIVIPHYDINGKLIGIRERTLIKEQEEYGKYKPAYINGTLYRHPLSFALFNLNNSKNNIKAIQKAIVFESEKSTMLYESYFGPENDISVAVCGSSLINYQVQLLLNCGAKEIIIAFDREGQKDDKTKYVQKFYKMQQKFGNLVQLSFMYDKDEKYLDWKQSPIDAGPDIFMEMFKERIIL